MNNSDNRTLSQEKRKHKYRRENRITDLELFDDMNSPQLTKNVAMSQKEEVKL